jgi:hypothetical protein
MKDVDVHSYGISDRRISSRFRRSGVAERVHLALEHLATSDDKLRVRVLDAYEDHLFALSSEEFPDQETRRAFETIKQIVDAVEEKISRKPGAYEAPSSQIANADRDRQTHTRLPNRPETRQAHN